MTRESFDAAKLSDPNWKGEEVTFDKNMSKKPSDNNRKTTDALCCIIFTVFLISLLGVTIYGYCAGDVWRLVAPIDQDGNICGFDTMEGYDHLYIEDVTTALKPNKDLFSYGVCVKECPKSAEDTVECNPACSATNEVYKTYELFGYCAFEKDDLPEDAQENYDATMESFANSYGGSAFTDIYGARGAIYFSPLLAVIFTFGYIYLMDKCAYYLSWISVVLIQLMLIGTAVGSYFVRQEYIEGMTQEEIKADYYAYTLNWTIWLSAIMAAFYYLMVACCFQSLKVAIAVIETAADFFADTKRVILVPVFFFFMGILVTVMWTIGIFCVSSIGTITVDDPLTQAKHIVWETPTYYMFYFMIFGLLWLLLFLLAFNDFVVIVSAVTWYYSDKTIPDDDGIPGDSDVWYGFKWGWRYHMGSLALGSFAVAVVTIIRAIMNYIANKLRDASGDNGCTKFLICCMQCCINCFDRFIKFITRNAYIYIAITSNSFCHSAIDAFIMMLKNSVKFGFVDGIADVFIFLAKFLITALTTFISKWLIKWWSPELESAFLPLLTIFILTWVISSVFMAIFDVGSNTILQCYLLDKQIAAQEGLEDPSHIPPTMAKFFKSQDIERMMNKHVSDDKGLGEPLTGVSN